MPFASPVTRFARLPVPERRVVLGATLGLPAVAVLVPLLGPSRLLNARPRVSRRAHHTVTPSRLVSLVASTGSWLPWHPTCLHRSIVSAWLLGRADWPCTVVLAVRRPGERVFDAHAWIEVDGVPAEPLPDGSWTSLLRWPMARAPR